MFRALTLILALIFVAPSYSFAKSKKTPTTSLRYGVGFTVIFALLLDSMVNRGDVEEEQKLSRKELDRLRHERATLRAFAPIDNGTLTYNICYKSKGTPFNSFLAFQGTVDGYVGCKSVESCQAGQFKKISSTNFKQFDSMKCLWHADELAEVVDFIIDQNAQALVREKLSNGSSI